MKLSFAKVSVVVMTIHIYLENKGLTEISLQKQESTIYGHAIKNVNQVSSSKLLKIIPDYYLDNWAAQFGLRYLG